MAIPKSNSKPSATISSQSPNKPLFISESAPLARALSPAP
jgi:hypothetical protein